MRNFIRKTLALGAIALALTVGAGAIDVVVDSQPLAMDVPPTIENSRTLVPLRAIFERLGAEIVWDGATQTVTATKDTSTISLTIGQNTAYQNGKAITLDTPAKIIEGRTLVPVRFVSEALGAKVFWQGDTQTVRIASKLYDVVRVVDGDTIVVNFQGKDEKVRLIGINTPESVHSDASKNTEAGRIASDFTKNLLTDKQVELEFDVQERDHYGRLLAYVYLEGKMVNKTLLEAGHATIATYPPNVKYVDDFKAIAKPETTVSPTPDPEQATTPTSGAFVGSTQSDKYHTPGCRWAKKITDDNRIWFKDAEDAKNQGYTPCGTCQ